MSTLAESDVESLEGIVLISKEMLGGQTHIKLMFVQTIKEKPSAVLKTMIGKLLTTSSNIIFFYQKLLIKKSKNDPSMFDIYQPHLLYFEKY